VDEQLARPDDVSVVIGVRDRADYRLANALRSLREQTYPSSLVRVIVVDYGSGQAGADDARRRCAEGAARYVRVDDAPVWSRSRCLNVGIRLSDTKYLLTSDTDIVFSPTYLADAVRLLAASPLSIVCSAMLDLPEESAGALESSALTGSAMELDSWKAWCRPRYGWDLHPSISMTHTVLYQTVRGLDECYEVWGYEDADLMRRFVYLGLTPTTLGLTSFYLHQWHPDAERGRFGPLALQAENNEAYFWRKHSIVRNGHEWGLGSRRSASYAR